MNDRKGFRDLKKKNVESHVKKTLMEHCRKQKKNKEKKEEQQERG